MPDVDPQMTQADIGTPIAAELAESGFEDAEEVGRGGFGVVYRCVERSLDRVVAVKVLSSDLDRESRERFLREEHAMARMSGHPNIVQVLHAGVTSGGRPYIVMPFHSRDSLDAHIRRDGPLEWGEALRVGVKVAGALGTAHRLGTLHRDVKPANILLTGYGEPQLTDFGIARIAGGFQTTSNLVAGSPSFTAPEVLNGESPSAASDVYSLGATLFCLLTGHPAFERHTGEKVVSHFMRITSDPIPDLRSDGVPDDVSAAIEAAMAKEATDRPATAADFGNRLRQIQRQRGRHVDELALPTDQEVAQASRRLQRTVSQAEPSTPSRILPGPKRHSSGRAHTPPSTSTKFRPPTSTHPLVSRSRLIDKMRSGPIKRLIVIHAPAGFGKSTLAAQWRDMATDAGVPVAWLSVDRDDDHVVWFVAHLIEAIRMVRPTLANELVQALEEHGDDAESYVLTSLINEIHESRSPIVIVIDDWHRITDAATIAALDFLLEYGCHHMQLIVTSRALSGLPIGRMRVSGELLEIDSTDLRFDAPEAQEFLIDRCGLQLEPTDVADLERTTDGWVAALQLAALSLRDHPDPSRLIRHMSGRHQAIGEYLVENVLKNLEPDLLDFLMSTSIVERLCGDLASALARVDRGQAMLEEVVARDLFLYNIDDDCEWFRYQPLFAQFLRRRLELDHPERISGLHRVASDWFAKHQLVSDAVGHALAAADQELAVSLVEGEGMDLIERSQMATLLELVAKLPAAAAATRPQLQVAVAWSNCVLRRPGPMQAALGRVSSALERADLAASEAAELRVNADLIRAAVMAMCDQVDGVRELITEALASRDTLRPWLAQAATAIAVYLDVCRFDFDAARLWHDTVSLYEDRQSGPFGVVAIESYVGIAANQQLDVLAAEQSFRNAHTLARRSLGGRSYASRMIAALLGELLYERDDLTEADRLIEESYELGPAGGVDMIAATYGTGARVKMLLGDPEAAARRLDEGARIANTLSLPRLAARIDNERIRWGLARPNPDDRGGTPVGDSTEQLRKSQSRTQNGIRTLTTELEEDSAIRSLLAAPSQQRLKSALTRAQALVDGLEDQGRPRALLQAKLLLTACLFESGRIPDAKQVLAPVAATCRELNLPRLLQDAGPQVAAVLLSD